MRSVSDRPVFLGLARLEVMLEQLPYLCESTRAIRSQMAHLSLMSLWLAEHSVSFLPHHYRYPCCRISDSIELQIASSACPDLNEVDHQLRTHQNQFLTIWSMNGATAPCQSCVEHCEVHVICRSFVCQPRSGDDAEYTGLWERCRGRSHRPVVLILLADGSP